MDLDENLAELIGIYLGDGHLCKNGLIITCGRIDENYITEYIPNLIGKVFNKKGNVFYFKNTKAIQLRVYSRGIANYLKNEFGLKFGKKRDIIIPKVILKNKRLTISCIRGLFDTDGGIYRHHKNNLQIIFFNSQKSLIYSVKNALKKLDYNPRVGKNNENHCLYLFGKEAVRYYNEIGFSNQKNITKYTYWSKYKRVPLNKELECGCRESNPGLNVFAM